MIAATIGAKRRASVSPRTIAQELEVAAWVSRPPQLLHSDADGRGGALRPAGNARPGQPWKFGLHARSSVRSCLEHDIQRVDHRRSTDAGPADSGACLPLPPQ
jgi:hypothetical protein